ncbi:hypothetical protein ACNITO_26820, partial [Escherichia coli]
GDGGFVKKKNKKKPTPQTPKTSKKNKTEKRKKQKRHAIAEIIEKKKFIKYLPSQTLPGHNSQSPPPTQ